MSQGLFQKLDILVFNDEDKMSGEKRIEHLLKLNNNPSNVINQAKLRKEET